MSRRAFRWMGKSMTSVIPALSLTLLIGLALWPSKASAENNAPPLEEVVRVEGEARRQALAVLAELELARTKEKTKWRWRKTPSENKARAEEGKTERIARQGGIDPGRSRVGEGKADI